MRRNQTPLSVLKVEAVGAGRCELEREIAPGITKFVIAAPLRTRGVADAFLAPVDVPVVSTSMRAFALADPPVWVTWKVVAVPAGSSFQSYGKGDAVLLGGGGMRVGGISGAFGCGLGQRADCSGRLLGFACECACCVFAIRGMAKLAWLISVVGLFRRGV